MGLMDKVKGGVRHLWSPITVWMADTGSDPVVHAGKPAMVRVDVRGEDDGTAERVELMLQVRSSSIETRTFRLAEFPPTVGMHELQVQIPTGLPPSCEKFVEYAYDAKLHRTKGTPSNAGMLIDVVSRPEDLYWPDGPRAGQDGAGGPRMEIELDADAVPMASAITGSVTLTGDGTVAGRPVEAMLEITRTVPSSTKPGTFTARTKTVAAVELAPPTALVEGQPVRVPLRLDVPAGVPPTVHDGFSAYVFWTVVVRAGDARAWRRVGVLDPESTAGIRNRSDPSLVDFLDGFV